jgi:hypothetical protein
MCYPLSGRAQLTSYDPEASRGFSNYEMATFLAELIKRSPVRIVSIATSDHKAFTDADF